MMTRKQRPPRIGPPAIMPDDPVVNMEPRLVAVVVAPTDPGIERREGFLDSDCLFSVRVIEHHSDRSVPGGRNRLNPRVLLRDVIAVRGGVTPLDFYRVGGARRSTLLRRR